MTDVDVVLGLSDPVIAGDTATATVTAHYNGAQAGRRVGYLTVGFTLARRRAAWAVVRSEVLGVS